MILPYYFVNFKKKMRTLTSPREAHWRKQKWRELTSAPDDFTSSSRHGFNFFFRREINYLKLEDDFALKMYTLFIVEKSWNFVPEFTIIEKDCALYQTIVGPHQAMMRMDKNFKDDSLWLCFKNYYYSCSGNLTKV